MILKIISFVLRAPYHLFMLFSFGAACYAAYNNLQGITWATPVIIGIIGLLYIGGVFASKFVEYD